MNLHIKDSYKTTAIADIRARVIDFYDKGLLGKNRSIESYVAEWCAHNFLYEIGLFRSHTKDVDLNDDENLCLRAGYWLLYVIYWLMGV